MFTVLFLPGGMCGQIVKRTGEQKEKDETKMSGARETSDIVPPCVQSSKVNST